jgi:hypothetical protein
MSSRIAQKDIDDLGAFVSKLNIHMNNHTRERHWNFLIPITNDERRMLMRIRRELLAQTGVEHDGNP